MMPANAYAFLHAGNAFNHARKKLKDNITTFKRLTAGIAALQHPHELPVFILEDGTGNVFSYLLSRDTFISSFAYPDPLGPKINRIVLSALHTSNDLDILASQLAQYFSIAE